MVPRVAGPTLVFSRLPTRPVNGSSTDEPRGRLLAGSGSDMLEPPPRKAVDTGARRDSSAQPARAIVGKMASVIKRMFGLHCSIQPRWYGMEARGLLRQDCGWLPTWTSLHAGGGAHVHLVVEIAHPTAVAGRVTAVQLTQHGCAGLGLLDASGQGSQDAECRKEERQASLVDPAGGRAADRSYCGRHRGAVVLAKRFAHGAAYQDWIVRRISFLDELQPAFYPEGETTNVTSRRPAGQGSEYTYAQSSRFLRPVGNPRRCPAR